MTYLHEPNTVLIRPKQNQDFTVVENKLCTQGYLKRANILTNKVLKASTSHNLGIHPRLFCRRWFGLEAVKESGRPRFLEAQILAMESEHGYREKCINLLSRLLKIKPNTIQRWGKGVSFDKIPGDKRQKYEIYLGYVDSVRIIAESLHQLDESSLLKLLQKLEAR